MAWRSRRRLPSDFGNVAISGQNPCVIHERQGCQKKPSRQIPGEGSDPAEVVVNWLTSWAGSGERCHARWGREGRGRWSTCRPKDLPSWECENDPASKGTIAAECTGRSAAGAQLERGEHHGRADDGLELPPMSCPGAVSQRTRTAGVPPGCILWSAREAVRHWEMRRDYVLSHSALRQEPSGAGFLPGSAPGTGIGPTAPPAHPEPGSERGCSLATGPCPDIAPQIWSEDALPLMNPGCRPLQPSQPGSRR